MTPLTLGIDLETSGLVRPGLPLDDPSQPHVLELSARLVDGEGRTVSSMDALIRPDGWSVEAGAEAVHGISEAFAYRHGIALPAVLVMLQAMCERAGVFVAHHAIFERQMITAELSRLNANGRWWASRANDWRCTMELSTPIMKIPGQFGDYRWPKLQEAMAFFFPNEQWETNHRSGRDVDACLRVWRALQKEKGDDH